jgi:hypothetical protein
MYVIIHVLKTDYDPSNDQKELQELAAELNKDARDNDQPDRWMVIDATTAESLFATTNH